MQCADSSTAPHPARTTRLRSWLIRSEFVPEIGGARFLLLAQRDQRIYGAGTAGRHVARHERCAKEDQAGDDYHGEIQCPRAEEHGLHGAAERIRSRET